MQNTGRIIYFFLLKSDLTFFRGRNFVRPVGSPKIFLWRKNYVRHEQPPFQVQAFRIEFEEKSGPGMDLICMIDVKMVRSTLLEDFVLRGPKAHFATSKAKK